MVILDNRDESNDIQRWRDLKRTWDKIFWE